MKRNYTTGIIQRGICLFLLVPLILGISISEMRASTQALYRAWNLKAYSMEDVAWECEVLDEKEERNVKDRGNLAASQVQNIRHTYGFENSKYLSKGGGTHPGSDPTGIASSMINLLTISGRMIEA